MLKNSPLDIKRNPVWSNAIKSDQSKRFTDEWQCGLSTGHVIRIWNAPGGWQAAREWLRRDADTCVWGLHLF